ncbi:hypothetical protein PL373_16070 [Tenacibaculum maritimum]|nr:hypothetical protein [Tenacibaculum maritimum]MDB0602618.1 hypothetical protein [Tenacibaculum maritimum]MDB0611270.1 hypothetical protein [Tenacibaculum maritimum]
MNIELKVNFTNEMLHATSDLLQAVYSPIISLEKNDKIIRSIGLELAKSFLSKKEKSIKKANLLNVKKKAKITLKYYEAWALHQIIFELISLAPDDYTKLQLQTTLNKLNELL